MSRVRRVGAAAALCSLGALLVLLGSSMPWAQVSFPAIALSPEIDAARAMTYSARAVGQDAVPALGLVGLAAAGALLAVSGTRRRAVAALILAAGAAVVLLSVRFQLDGWSPGRDGGAGPQGWVSFAPGNGSLDTAYGALAAAGGGAVLVGAGLLAMLARDRASLGARYDAPARRAQADDTDAWNAIDRGEDPTEGFTQP